MEKYVSILEVQLSKLDAMVLSTPQSMGTALLLLSLSEKPITVIL